MRHGCTAPPPARLRAAAVRAPRRTGACLLACGAVVAGTAILAACAPAPLTRADVDGLVVCNAERMAEVEARARREGVVLRWVNCPRATLRAQ
jgi:hypothetical protein